jgi:hypothetical protein
LRQYPTDITTTLRGWILESLIHLEIDGSHEPTCQETAELVPQELLKLAREWRRWPEEVIARLKEEPPLADRSQNP